MAGIRKSLLARCRSAEGAALCPSDMMLCVIPYWVLSGAKRRQIQQLRCCVLPAKMLKRRDVYLKLTRHNGRAGTHGTYNPKHNDRSFNLANSEHIDQERAKGNIYWDCFHGFRSVLAPPDPDDLAATFSDVERRFYETHYTAFVEGQNERNAKNRHTERNRSIPDLLSSRKTCPEETICQLGTLDEHASAEDLLNIVTEFIDEFKAKFGDHVHVLDWALHLDESTPHIHERHVFDCENQYGEIAPQQEKALEALGFELPDPAKPLSRRNNRKITFDAACRKMLFEIAKRHGLDLEEEAEYGNRKYLEKQDFILAKQKEQLAAQQSKLDELTLKVNDMETLIDEVSAAAYDKAVEVVTDVVRTETRKEDMRMIEDTKKWVLSPERKAAQSTREYAAHRLDDVLNKFLKTMLLGKPCVFPESLLFVSDINFHKGFKCHGQVCRLLKKELPLPRQSILLGGKSPFQLLLLHTLPVLEVEGSVPCALPVVLVGWHPITPPLPRRFSPDSTSCLPGLPRSCSPWLSVPRSTGRSFCTPAPARCPAPLPARLP